MHYITGDTHIPIDIKKLNTKNFPQQKNMTKNDYLTIVGDFGLLWDKEFNKEELYWKEWLENKNFTTLFIDGNHENHRRLLSGFTAKEIIRDKLETDEYKIEEKFGGYVGKISSSIYHLRRGEVYIIENKKIFVMGGALSIDKSRRLMDVSWWKEEEPNYKEFCYGIDNLKKNDNSVDYILGHTITSAVILECFDDEGRHDSVSNYFDHITSFVLFDGFYCGHFHRDIDYNKYHILFDRIIKLE